MLREMAVQPLGLWAQAQCARWARRAQSTTSDSAPSKTWIELPAYPDRERAFADLSARGGNAVRHGVQL